MQVWPEPVVAFPQRVASAAGIVERDLAVVGPGASADSLLPEDIGTQRDQGGKRQPELAIGHAALPYEEINLDESTNQGRSAFLFEGSVCSVVVQPRVVPGS